MITNKEIYLTIDDFPTKKSGELLDFLSQNNIPALIFCIGEHVKKQEDLAVEALRRGFILGNHSYTHKSFSKICLRKAFREIVKTDELLEKIYTRADLKWEKKYFRFPYGDKGDGNAGRVFTVSNDPRKRLKKRKIQQKLAELEYINFSPVNVSYRYYTDFLSKERDVSWTLDSMEWCIKKRGGMFGLKTNHDLVNRLFSDNPPDCRGVVPETNYGLLYKPSAEILLMHDHKLLIGSVKLILLELLERGYSFGKFS